MRSDADLGSLQRPAPPPASCGYNDSDANLLAVGQTIGQQTRTVRDMSDQAHAPDATVAAVHAQRFCPGTEEVTGSNPVSPTNIFKPLTSRNTAVRGFRFPAQCQIYAR
jgi:hypothetical protein